MFQFPPQSSPPADSCFDLRAAASGALAELHQRTGFDLWMITRRIGNDWIIWQINDHGYDVEVGTVLNWTDSFCYRMVSGSGPQIAPVADQVEAYACAPIKKTLQIGAYAGVPLVAGDGALLGTLCAIHPTPLPESIHQELPLITAIANLISGLLAAELTSSAASRRVEKLEAALLRDELTGLFNRRAWNTFLAAEEQRCVRLGSSVGIIVVDLDNLKQINDTQGHLAGDDYICRAAAAIQDALALRDDYSARLGGDEFAILCIDCDAELLNDLAERIRSRLSIRQVQASVGAASRQPLQRLTEVLDQADKEMYRCKRHRAAQNSDRQCGGSGSSIHWRPVALPAQGT